MNAKLLIDGKEFDIEILDPKLQELLVPPKKKTGYERVELEEDYYFVDTGSEVISKHKYNTHEDDFLTVIGNCYSEHVVAENNSRADKLMRQLRRFAVEHRKNDVNWKTNYELFEIWYDYRADSMTINEVWGERVLGTIPFDSEETAQLAIDTFHDELIWYFTEYKDSL